MQAIGSHSFFFCCLLTSVAEDSIEDFRASTIGMREKLECALRPILNSCCTSDETGETWQCHMFTQPQGQLHTYMCETSAQGTSWKDPTKREVLPDRASFNKPTAGVVCHEHHVRTVYNKLRKANVEHTTSAEC